MMDITLTPVLTASLTTMAGKLFIILADSAPPITDNAPYLVKWGYNFIQLLASNSSKIVPLSVPKNNP